MPECNLWNSRKKRLARNGISRRNRPNLDIVSNSVQNVAFDSMTSWPNRETARLWKKRLSDVAQKFFPKEIWQEEDTA